ncbi:PREDICTED: replication protein A 70 kDa DNA-binding subunit C-like [Ipomoea nil]|uniref:replication protein A 70 kDa DNA-binding subunit C-like n=1 Tax=Ipomoea nil TaxID=35883 RepID=UPI000900DD17|nr:PREDICTED: replication protein A 70 kDa DNA-binding subunit C-like [Ipomoea nil]
MPGQFILCSEIHPQQTSKAMRLRLVHTYLVFEGTDEKVIRSRECVFHDSAGSFIHVQIPKDQVQKYSSYFQEGNVYGIRNFLCITNYFKYKTSDHKYMTKFKFDTAVKQYRRIDFPDCMFRIKSFRAVLEKDGVNENELFDVIGRVVEIYSPVDKVIGGKATRKKQLQCTMWGGHVELLMPYFNLEFSDPVVVLVQLCRARFLQNGEVRISSSFDATQLIFDHSSKVFADFRKSVGSDYTPLRCKQSDSRFGLRLNVPMVDSDTVVTSIAELYQNQQLGQFWVAGKVLGIENYLDWFYFSCKNNSCNKKVIKLENGLMHCPKCLRSWGEGIMRYRVVLRVADQSGDAPMLVWDRECSRLIGMSAVELRSMYSQMVDFVPVELQQLAGMVLLFRVTVSKDQLQSLQSPFHVLSVSIDNEVVSQHSSSVVVDSPLTQVPQGLGPQVDEGDGSEDFWVLNDEDCDGLDGIDNEVVNASDSLPLKRSLLEEFEDQGVSKKSKAVTIKQEK